MIDPGPAFVTDDLGSAVEHREYRFRRPGLSGEQAGHLTAGIVDATGHYLAAAPVDELVHAANGVELDVPGRISLTRRSRKLLPQLPRAGSPTCSPPAAPRPTTWSPIERVWARRGAGSSDVLEDMGEDDEVVPPLGQA